MIITSADIYNPIIVIKQFANEDQYGLCPPLSSEIRELNTSPEMSASVPYEEAISLELAKIEVPYISGDNYLSRNSLSANVFINDQSHNIFNFKTVVLSGDLEADIDSVNKTATFYTTLSGDPGTKEEITYQTSNGGSRKETFLVGWEDFYYNSNQANFYLPTNNISIDKVIVEVIEPFSYAEGLYDTSSSEDCIGDTEQEKFTEFTIGTSGNTSGIYTTFRCPAISGEISGIYLGTEMNYKIKFLSNEQLKIYKTSDTIDTNGLFRISVFYNDLTYLNDTGKSFVYFGGKNESNVSDEIEVLDYTTLTEGFIRGTLISDRCGYALNSIGDKICLIANGSNSITLKEYNLITSQEKFDGNTFTIASHSGGSFTGVLAPTSIDGKDTSIIVGGFTSYHEDTNYQCTNQIIELDHSTELYSSLTTLPINIAGACGIGVFPFFTEGFLLGGRSFSGSKSTVSKSDFTNNGYKVNISTGVPSVTNLKLINKADGSACVQDTTKVWIAGGNYQYNSSEQDSGDLLNDIQTLNIENQTIATKNIKILSQKRGYLAGNTNVEKTKGYFAGGGSISENDKSQYHWIDVVEFSTDTICVKCRTKLAEERSVIQGFTN